jgi:FtsH-binding integral membrane protein
MDLRRLRAGEWIAAASGMALLISLWLPWYSGDDLGSGWRSLAAIDVLLALIAATAVTLLVITATQSVPAVPVAFTVLVFFAAIVGTVLVLARIAWAPDGTAGREWGLWLALAGSIGIVTGALVAMRDERLSPSGRHTDLTGRPADPPPEIETIPAPRA